MGDASPTDPGPRIEHRGGVLPGKGKEDGEIARVRRRVVALRRAAHGREGGLVEELRRRDLAPRGLRERQQLLRLRRGPDPAGIARSGADREAGDDPGIHGSREVDHAAPLLARQHPAKPRGRGRRRGRVGVVEVGGVGPGAADPHVGRLERRGERAQPRAGQVYGRAEAEQGRVDAGHRGLRCWRGFGRRAAGRAVGRPEAATGHLHHLHVVRLEALVHRAHLRHLRRLDGDRLRTGGRERKGDGGERDQGRAAPRLEVVLHRHRLQSVERIIASPLRFSNLGQTRRQAALQAGWRRNDGLNKAIRTSPKGRPSSPGGRVTEREGGTPERPPFEAALSDGWPAG